MLVAYCTALENAILRIADEGRDQRLAFLRRAVARTRVEKDQRQRA